VNDIVIVQELVCITPVNDTVIIHDITPTELTISSYGNWAIDPVESSASIYTNQVSFSIQSENASIIADEDSEYTFSGEVIGTISAGGRPSSIIVLDHTNNGGIPAGSLIIIEPSGAIRFAGTITITVANEATVIFENLTYTI
jgi:hypothetical protein